jgi:TRAP-type C4-dicarboxylate transport system permease small subunit
MKHVIRRGLLILDKVNEALALFGTVVLVVISVLICVNAITRIWHFYWMGLLEIARYSLVWMAFCGAAWLLRRGEGHISVDTVTSKLSPRARALTEVITASAGVITFAFFTWYSFKITLYHFQMDFFISDSVLRSPKGPFECIIPLGCFLLTIELIRKVYERWMDWKGAKRG